MRPDARLARLPLAPLLAARRLARTPPSLLAALLAAALLSAAGCCSVDPLPLEEMHAKNLRTPYNALDYFRTAVRYGAWDAVYDALSPRSRAEIDDKVGRFAFETFAGGLTMKRLDPEAPPEYAELTVADLVHRSEILRVEPDERSRDRWWVQLYLSIGGKPIPTRRTRFPLVRVPAAKPGDASRWTVGLTEWLEGE